MKPHLLTVARGSNQGARNEETPLIQHADANFFSAALGSASAGAELAPAGLVLAPAGLVVWPSARLRKPLTLVGFLPH